MEYRLAKHDELEQLAHLRWAMWEEDGEDPAQLEQATFVAEFVRWLEQRLGDNWFAFCAIENGEVVSQIYIQRIEKAPKPSAPVDAFGYVTAVYTKRGYRNKGVGKELLRIAREWARSADLEFLVLWPSERSVSFWGRSGFAEGESLVREIRPYVN